MTTNYPTNLSTARKSSTYLEHFIWLPLLTLSLCLFPPTFSIFIFWWRSMGGRCGSWLLLANRYLAGRDSPSFTFFQGWVVLSLGELGLRRKVVFLLLAVPFFKLELCGSGWSGRYRSSERKKCYKWKVKFPLERGYDDEDLWWGDWQSAEVYLKFPCQSW